MALPSTYTVVKGDTLSEIAQKYYKEAGYSNLWTYVDYLADLNNLANKNYIVVGQVLKLSGNKDTVKENKTYTPSIRLFGLVGSDSDSSREVYAEWKFDQKNVDYYEVQWDYYLVVNGKKTTALQGRRERVEVKYDTYTVPNDATDVRFRVRPVAKNKEWTGNWLTWQTYDFSDNPPPTPSSISISIDGYNLTVTTTGIDTEYTSQIQFYVYSTDNGGTKKYEKEVAVVAGQASATFTVAGGYDYYFECRGKRNKVYGNWSDPSDIVGTPPGTPTISTCKASTETSIQLEWDKLPNVKSFKLEYTTNETYFEGSDQVQSVDGIEGTSYLKTGLETGKTYYFRVKATNDNGESGWSEVKSTVLGSGPAAPSTWSSTTTVMVGEKLTLYWVHNTEDGSEQTGAKIEMEIGGVTNDPIEIKDDTNFYEIDTSGYSEGTIIRWRVCTSALSGDFGDWSVQRRVDVFTPPSVSLSLKDANDVDMNTLLAFPIKVSATISAGIQKAIGYHITIVAGPNGESFETTNNMGETITLKDGDEVYSKYINCETLAETISANDVSFENGYTYTIKCVATMNSGLTGEDSKSFSVDWSNEVNEYVPNAIVMVDEDTLTASIQPYLKDIDENLIPDVRLSVYRKNYDGTFTEIISNLDNSTPTWVTDPHPALDYARYRIVARYNSTGIIAFTDMPHIPVKCGAIVIQWDEESGSYEDLLTGDQITTPSWVGSMLVLPYNVDISDTIKPDVEQVSYIGRQHPVAYYGTQLGESSKWNTVIDKMDTDTLYKLRRLAKWMGNVYVREPSGCGYWANVTVSWNIKHDSLVIPISIDVVRVEGGK